MAKPDIKNLLDGRATSSVMRQRLPRGDDDQHSLVHVGKLATYQAKLLDYQV